MTASASRSNVIMTSWRARSVGSDAIRGVTRGRIDLAARDTSLQDFPDQIALADIRSPAKFN
jgi:hypothetical protein